MSWPAVGLLLLTVLLPLKGAFADTYARETSMEWEPIPDATSYDIEIKSTIGGEEKPQVISKITETKKDIKLPPGNYLVRIRSRDRRNVAGTWSAPIVFPVGLDPVKMKSPTTNQIISASEPELQEISFEWEDVGGADEYHFELTDEDGAIVTNEKLQKNKFQIKLPVAKKFKWKINAYTTSGLHGDENTSGQLTLLGPKLERPKIKAPDNEWVRELTWENPQRAKQIEYILSRYDPKTKKYLLIDKKQDPQQQLLPFQKNWPGGRYRFLVRATSPLRVTSDTAKIEFQVRGGDRSPASENIATVRKSIDRTNGWFLIASYLVTYMQYENSFTETGSNGTSINVNVVGGTGRLGAGYLAAGSPWGFLGIIDYSGFLLDSKKYTFASTEFSGIYRTTSGERGEIRQIFGLYTKEIPMLLGTTNSFTGAEKITSLGPHYGAEYWYALSPTIGFKTHGHAYYSLLKRSTPNGGAIVPSLSWELGILGSMRLSKKATGLMGYVYKKDSASYKSASGFNNSVGIAGHYLNFFLEYPL